jgi:DNA polymerase III delta prime subunit
MSDDVNSPAHYTQGSMETIEAIEGLNLNYHQGNIIKYVSRYNMKGGIQDLQKARWYLDRLILLEERSIWKEKDADGSRR